MQEFPDDWEFCGKTPEQYAQVGNAVPVRLGNVCGVVVAEGLEAIYKAKFEKAAGVRPPCRAVYVKSHIRTRQWFKAGKTFVWQDGEDNGHAKYGPAKTERKIREL